MALDIRDSVASLPCNAVAVLQLFDNVAYHAVTMEDTIILCRKDQQGKYHLDKDLLERLQKAIRDQLLANGVRNYTVLNPLWLLASDKTTDADLQHWTCFGMRTLSTSPRLATSSSGMPWKQRQAPCSRTVAAEVRILGRPRIAGGWSGCLPPTFIRQLWHFQR